MDSNLAQKAISAALTCNWNLAIELNNKILLDYPNDIDALNRLARANAEIGKLDKAKGLSNKVIKLDPFNSIALKALDRWNKIKSTDTLQSFTLLNNTFLEEPGKTKIVSLLHLGPESIIVKLDSGDEIKLDCHPRRISALTVEGKYIGRLPDDLSLRLKKLSKLGYEYKTYIKSIEKDEVKIFIKETKKGCGKNNITSFPLEKIDYVSFTPPELVRKKEKLQVTEE